MTLPIYQLNSKKPTVNIMVYGEPGVGKTTLAATAASHPDMGKVLVLNVEGGLLSIRNNPNVEAIDIESAAQLEKIYYALANGDSPQFKTIVLDSGTELQTLHLEEVVKDAVKKKSGRTLDEIYLEDYGKNTSFIRRIVRWYKELDRHFIMTALVKREWSNPAMVDRTAPDIVRPAFTAKLGTHLQGYFDYVWYMATKTDDDGNVQRNVLTRAKAPYVAKTRIEPDAEFPMVITNPNLSDIYNQLFQE